MVRGFFTLLAKAGKNAIRTWNRVQIGHRGKYSVERVLAFHDYKSRTSPVRVLAVCLLAPVPAVLAALLVECIPLNDPAAGFAANYTLWIRLSFTSFTVAAGVGFQAKETIEPRAISSAGVFLTAAATATCHVGIYMAIAKVWVFPIPYGIVLSVVPFVLFLATFFVLTVGPRTLWRRPTLRRQLVAQMCIVIVQALLVLTYPAFSAVFNQLSGIQQTAFVFVLPTIKFIMKQAIARASAHLGECVAPIVVFSVDVFNVLYMSICMQTAESPLTAVAILTTDACHIALAIRSIHGQTKGISNCSGAQDSKRRVGRPTNYLQSVLEMIRQTLDECAATNASSCSVPMLAPFPLSLSDESRRMLDELWCADRLLRSKTIGSATAVATRELVSLGKPSRSRHEAFGEDCSKCPRCDSESPDRGLLKLSCLRSARIHPSRDLVMQVPPSATRGSRLGSYLRRVVFPSVTINQSASVGLTPDCSPQAISTEEAAQEALRTLFHSEYVVLVEYIECLLPLLYAGYLVVLCQLPTSIYYPNTRSLPSSKLLSTVVSLVLYTALEFASLVGLHVLLQRKFGFSPAYQLAFVLESQAHMIQGHLAVWIMYNLHFTLEHYGVDFTFQFQWLDDTPLGD